MVRRINIFPKMILLFIIAIYLCGCGYFPKNLIAPLNSFPDVSHYENKPQIFIDLKRFSGNPDKGKVYPKMFTQKEHEIYTSTVESSGLFSKVEFDDYLKKDADYTIEFYLYAHAKGALLGILLPGFSMGLIPYPVDTILTLKTRVIDKHENTIDEYKNQDIITFWFHLFLIPFGDKSFNDAPTVINMINDSLKHLVEGANSPYVRMVNQDVLRQ